MQQVQALYPFGPEAIFAFTDFHCRILAKEGFPPFYHLVLDLLDDVPDEAKEHAMQVARRLLMDEAFSRLDRSEKLESDILNHLLEIPSEISDALSKTMMKNAATFWNQMAPEVVQAIHKEMQPQKELLESVFGQDREAWNTLPAGPDRLKRALEASRQRLAMNYADVRPDQFEWIAAWGEELVWSWETLQETVAGVRDLFSDAQQHLLTRLLRAVYQPKCPSPCLPVPVKAWRDVYIPLHAEIQEAQTAQDDMLRTRLEAHPILPPKGAMFISERHNAPKMYWRPASAQSEQVNQIYDVRELGLERQGRVLMKATVSIIQPAETAVKEPISATVPAPALPIPPLTMPVAISSTQGQASLVPAQSTAPIFTDTANASQDAQPHAAARQSGADLIDDDDDSGPRIPS